MIKIENLSKSYGTNVVLKNVNATFNSGQVLGIVGKNGAGKSTLFKCIAQIESYDGNINFSEPDQIKKIGYLPTHPYVMSKITGFEYLQLLCNARKVDYDKSVNKNLFDLPLKEYAQNYSTGMLKKLALIGILLQKNDIYILDEPFNGLDIESNMMVNTVIQRLKNAGKMVLISSHMLTGLYEICDQINFIQNKTIKQINDKGDFKTLENEISTSGFNEKLNMLDF